MIHSFTETKQLKTLMIIVSLGLLLRKAFTGAVIFNHIQFIMRATKLAEKVSNHETLP